MADIHVIQHDEQLTAGIREQVPMGELTAFFARAFHDTMAYLQSQGVRPVGPPFGKYYGTPGETVDVEAGFPVDTTIDPAGNVVPGSLPAGKVLEIVHVGSYDTMHRSYSELERYFVHAGLEPGSIMWESYLSDPETEPDPTSWRTQICWLAQDMTTAKGTAS
jgi:effector-binding domain-containing protein